jgi:hypothetical protein
MNTESPEEIIRRYLLAVENPESLIDQDEITLLTHQYEQAIDPIEKLKALAALNRARTPDIVGYRAQFVEHARRWAEANDIPLNTFEQMGLDKRLLVDARLISVRDAKKRKGVPSPGGRSVSAKTIEAQISTMPDVFTLADVVARIGGSPMTVRKAIGEMTRSGRVINLGPTQPWSGPGRAPIQFLVSRRDHE